jgi:hypothetical protein
MYLLKLMILMMVVIMIKEKALIEHIRRDGVILFILMLFEFA